MNTVCFGLLIMKNRKNVVKTLLVMVGLFIVPYVGRAILSFYPVLKKAIVSLFMWCTVVSLWMKIM